MADLSELPVPAGSVQARDAARFSRLSNGYTIFHPDEPDVLGDARYAMLPYEMSPLWGIRLDRENPGSHVELVTFRRFTESMLIEYLDMVLGAASGDARSARPR